MPSWTTGSRPLWPGRRVNRTGQRRARDAWRNAWLGRRDHAPPLLLQRIFGREQHAGVQQFWRPVDLYRRLASGSGARRRRAGGLHAAAGRLRRPVLSLLRCAVDCAELPVTLADARRSLELITAMYSSVRTGQPVALPIDQSHPGYASWLPEALRHHSTASAASAPRPARAGRSWLLRQRRAASGYSCHRFSYQPGRGGRPCRRARTQSAPDP